MGGVALAAAALTAFFFWPIFVAPDSYFFKAGGDALQSYFATAFYTLHDHGDRFTGMNYPYGENFNFPNLQPLVALLMRGLQALGVPAGRHTVAITNLLPLASIAFTPVVLYAILRRSRLPVLYAAGMSLLIGFMSPQLLRLDGHISLSYTCFVPLLWYCIIRMQEAPRQWRWYGLFGLGSLLMGGVMLYFLACGAFFLLAHVLVLAWQQPRLRPWLGRMVLAALLPLLLFRGYLWATDHVADRPPNPFGLKVYVATVRTVFLPMMGPVYDWWQQHWPHEPDNEEGLDYVGLVATFTLLVSALAGVWRAVRRRRLVGSKLPPHLLSGLWAASLLLLLACGIPFIWPWFDWVTDHSGPVKQFRALGRFSWPFYYVATTYVAYVLYRSWRWLRRRQLAAVAWLGVPLLLCWGAEAWLQVAHKAGQVAEGIGALDLMDAGNGVPAALSWSKRSVSDFQAIMPVPYYNMGTDKLDLSGSSQAIYQADKAAIVTGLPLLATYVSRASIGYAMQHIQLLSSDLVQKELLDHLPNEKPLLLLVTPDILTEGEQRLIRRAHLLRQTPELSLYELPLAALRETALLREQTRADSLLPHLRMRAGGLRVTTSAGVVLRSFEQAPDRRGRLGSGALHEVEDGFTTFYDGPVPAPADTGRYEAAVWVYGKSDYGFGNMRVRTYDAHGQTDEAVIDGRKSTEIQGEWVRMVVPFWVRPGTTRLEVLYQNRDLVADDFLLRPVNTDVYYPVGTGAGRKMVKNTYPLRP